MCFKRVRQALGRCIIRAGRYFDTHVLVCCDRLAFGAGPVLVLFGFILITGLATLGYMYVIPTQCHSVESQIAIKAFLTLGLTNIVARYVYAVGTNPGTVTSSVYAKIIEHRKAEPRPPPDDDDLPKMPPSMLTWSVCRHSHLAKPPRAHFDSVNKQLVVNFDHWCPWIFNSVGYGNYRHFVVLLAWVWCLCSVGSILTVKPFFEGLKRGRVQYEYNAEVAFAIVFCLCLALTLAVGILFGWHVYLMMAGMTSVDFNILMGRREKFDEDYPNPFDHGSIWSNLNQVLFSENGGLWELLIPPLPHWAPRGKPFILAW